MNGILEKYLYTVDKCLKPLPTSERVDIVKEIKSSIFEMESEKLSPEQIIERLGNPKCLAKAYLGDILSNNSKFSWNRFLTICAFYSLVGFSGIFVIPCLIIIAPTLIIYGISAPILSAVKVINYIFHLNIPYIKNVGIVLSGIVSLNPIVEFIISLIMGGLLYWVGRGAWKLLILYCKKVSHTHKDLEL